METFSLLNDRFEFVINDATDNHNFLLYKRFRKLNNVEQHTHFAKVRIFVDKMVKNVEDIIKEFFDRCNSYCLCYKNNPLLKLSIDVQNEQIEYNKSKLEFDVLINYRCQNAHNLLNSEHDFVKTLLRSILSLHLMEIGFRHTVVLIYDFQVIVCSRQQIEAKL